MARRRVPVLLLALASVLAVVGSLAVPDVAAAGDGAPDAVPVHAPRAFSPDGDGVQDTVRVRYRLERSARVTVTVTDRMGYGDVVLRRHLGRRSAGRHAWTWDGRLAGGKRARDNRDHLVTVRARSGSGVSEGRQLVLVDRRFRASQLKVGAPWGCCVRGGAAVVYPRSSDVRDSLSVQAVLREVGLARGALTIRDRRGRVVLRRSLPRHGRYSFVVKEVEWDGRDARDEPLPPGRYTAVVRGRDIAGNRGRSPSLALQVSEQRLEWHQEERSVRPSEGRDFGAYCATYSGANGCPDIAPCGLLLPSARFPDGLSHRAAPCTDYRAAWPAKATSFNLLEVPEAVRGVDSARVAFTGAPTFQGESDTGTLLLGDASVTSMSGAQTPWKTVWTMLGQPYDGRLPAMPPAVHWFFETYGDDAFDVGTYTVELRYLRPTG